MSFIGMSFIGIDRATYPGTTCMRALRRSTNVRWTSFPLAPAPGHHDTTWMPHLTDLLAMGWGVAPVFVGQQHPSIHGRSHVRTAEQGRQDALRAADLAARAALPPGSTIYLHVELPGALPRPDLTYVKAWCLTLRDTPYAPGVRCWAAAVPQLDPEVPLWVMASVGAVESGEWQRRANVTLTTGATQWAVHVSAVPDPSRPRDSRPARDTPPGRGSIRWRDRGWSGVGATLRQARDI
ncbi:hypothetical protein GCM10029964_071990 [Kibdelosporangium lantanae]